MTTAIVNGKRNVTWCPIKRFSYFPWRCSNSKFNSICCRCCSFYLVRVLFLTATASLFGYVWRNYFKLILAPTIYSNWKSIQCVSVIFFMGCHILPRLLLFLHTKSLYAHTEWRQIGRLETKESWKKNSFFAFICAREARIVFNHNIFKAFC